MSAVSYLSSPFTWILFCFGLVLGSFLNVCIFRIPEHNFWQSHRSFCRHCAHTIPFYYNIPIASFLWLRGKAACCKQPLSWQYPVVELITGIGFALIYWKFPFIASFGQAFAVDRLEFVRFFHAGVFFSLMLVCSVIDIRHMIIPDVVSIPMVLCTPVVVWLHPELRWSDALLGTVVGGGMLYLIAWLYWIVRREVGIGFGDVKLLAAIGGWLGYQSIIPTIFIGSTTGALVGMSAIILSKRLTFKSAIPFGPFLAFGAVVHLLFKTQVLEFIFY